MALVVCSVVVAVMIELAVVLVVTVALVVLVGTVINWLRTGPLLKKLYRKTPAAAVATLPLPIVPDSTHGLGGSFVGTVPKSPATTKFVPVVEVVNTAGPVVVVVEPEFRSTIGAVATFIRIVVVDVPPFASLME
jgi:hypothetical protein